MKLQSGLAEVFKGLRLWRLVAQLVKNPPAVWETWVRALGWEDPLEKGKATHSSYSGLENSMDSIVHGVAKESDTTERLSLRTNFRGSGFEAQLHSLPALRF